MFTSVTPDVCLTGLIAVETEVGINDTLSANDHACSGIVFKLNKCTGFVVCVITHCRLLLQPFKFLPRAHATMCSGEFDLCPTSRPLYLWSCRYKPIKRRNNLSRLRSRHWSIARLFNNANIANIWFCVRASNCSNTANLIQLYVYINGNVVCKFTPT